MTVNIIHKISTTLLVLIVSTICIRAERLNLGSIELYTIDSKEIELKIAGGYYPLNIQFDAKRTTMGIGMLYIDEEVDGEWHNIAEITLSTSMNSYSSYEINRFASKIKFYTTFGSTLYKTIENIELEIAECEKEQEIEWTQYLHNLVKGETTELTAKSSSGSAVSYTSSNEEICSIENNTLTANELGECIVIAKQEGNRIYKAALQVVNYAHVGLTNGTTELEIAHKPIAYYLKESNKISIEFESITDVILYDIQGRIMFQESYNKEDHIYITPPDKQPSIWLIEIRSNGLVHRLKILTNRK